MASAKRGPALATGWHTCDRCCVCPCANGLERTFLICSPYQKGENPNRRKCKTKVMRLLFRCVFVSCVVLLLILLALCWVLRWGYWLLVADRTDNRTDDWTDAGASDVMLFSFQSSLQFPASHSPVSSRVPSNTTKPPSRTRSEELLFAQ